MKLRYRILLVSSGLLVGLTAYIAVDVASFSPRSAGGAETGSMFPVYRGAIHIHSKRSDGSGSPAEIAAAAGRAGLDFAILSDHDVGPEAREDAGYFGDVLLLAGSEVSVPEAHMLYLPHPDSAFRDIEVLKSDIYTAAGQALMIVAHPFLPKRPLLKDTAHLTDGIEIVNADAVWRKISTWRLFEAVVMYPFFDYSMNVMAMLPEDNRALWERMLSGVCDTLKIIGSVDAHAKIKLGANRFLAFPPYDRVFSLIQTHVLTAAPLSRDFMRDARLIFGALERGRAYVTFENLGSTRGFEFCAYAPDTVYTMGDRMESDRIRRIRVCIPGSGGVRIRLKNAGETVAVYDGAELVYEHPGAGVYYAEVLQLRRIPPFFTIAELPWIITNVMYLQ